MKIDHLKIICLLFVLLVVVPSVFAEQQLSFATAMATRADNLLTNGDFSSGRSGWWDYSNTAEGGNASVSVVNGEACVTITGEGQNIWSVLFGQGNVSVEEGSSYQISFDAYATEARPLDLNLGLAEAPWTVYYHTQRPLTTEKETFTMMFVSEYTDNGSELVFQLGSHGENTVCIDNVSYEELYVPPTYDNLLNNEGFEEGLIDWGMVTVPPATAVISTSSEAACATISNGGTTPEAIRLSQSGVVLTAGQHYQLRYMAEADVVRDLTVQVGTTTPVFRLTHMLEPYDATYVHTFQATADTTTQLTFYLGGSTTAFCLDDVILEAVDPPAAVNLVENGGFWDETEGWWLNRFNGGGALLRHLDGEACIDVFNGGSAAWHVSIATGQMFIQAGASYEIRFDARADVPRTVEWQLYEADPSWETVGIGAVAIDTTMQTYTAVYTASVTDSYIDLALLVGNDTGLVCFDNVSVKEQVAAGAAVPVQINELMALNGTTLLDRDFGNFTDWIELYNPAAQPIDVSGFYISDDEANPRKWEIAAGSVIAPGGYLLIWADEETSGNHTNFKLSDNGETVSLYDQNEQLIDTVTYPAIGFDMAYGRETDGAATWGFMEGTAEQPNGMMLADQTRAAAPQFSESGGVYASAINVTLTAADTIHYTTDGSTPTRTSPTYTGAIAISDNTVVKAVAFGNGVLPSAVVAQTYLIDETSTLPIVSIGIAPDHLWDDEIGIYVEGTNGIDEFCAGRPVNWNQKWERPISIELYEPDGTQAFNENAGTRIFGGCSRNMSEKSLSVFFRDQYGEDTLDYQLFDTLSLDQYDAFVLRNSGNDAPETMMRDGMMQSLIAPEMDMDGQAYRPAAVFINGAYWGIMNIREKINEDYLHWHHNVDPDEVDILEYATEVNEGSADDYIALLNSLINNDLSDAANYTAIADQLDISQLIDYQIAQIYFANTDWPGNNSKHWREQPDGRWRWITYDLDFGFALYEDTSTASHNTLGFALSSSGPAWPNPPWSTMLFRSLIDNQAFEDEFVQRFAAYFNTIFASDHVVAHIDAVQDIIAPEMPNHIGRWGQPDTMAEWQENVDVLRQFAEQRPDYMRGDLENRFNLDSDLLDVTMNVVGPGHIEAHTVKMTDSSVTAAFYRDVPLQLQAVAADGYRFAGWQGAAVGQATETVINPAGDVSVTAVFERAEQLVINEIHYNPAPTQGDDEMYEFVELYNAGNTTIDLGGYALTDGVAFTFTAGATIAPDEYIVITIDPATYTGNGYQVFGWVSGKLANGGEQITLSDAQGNVVDTVTYDDEGAWTAAPDGTGPSFSLSETSLDNQIAANWVASSTQGGTPGIPNTAVPTSVTLTTSTTGVPSLLPLLIGCLFLMGLFSRFGRAQDTAPNG